MYPVGSIYITINNANPSTLFGGVWEQIKDTFLLGTGDKYAAGTTGGEATHTLTIEETPSHKHGLRRTDGGVLAGAWDTVANGNNTGYFSTMGKNRYASYETTNVGGSQSHNNMPPYLTVYIWKRMS